MFAGEWLQKNIGVAVKILHDVPVDARMDKEAAMLAELDHENVVRMYGVCRASERNLYLVLELMNQGDLKSYVYERKPKYDNYSQFPPALLTTELIDISRQVSLGVIFGLSSLRFRIERNWSINPLTNRFCLSIQQEFHQKLMFWTKIIR